MVSTDVSNNIEKLQKDTLYVLTRYIYFHDITVQSSEDNLTEKYTAGKLVSTRKTTDLGGKIYETSYADIKIDRDVSERVLEIMILIKGIHSRETKFERFKRKFLTSRTIEFFAR